MKTVAIRGAITIAADEKNEIQDAVKELLTEMRSRNANFADAEPVSLIISSTADITAYYPAAAVRDADIIDVPLFSALEPPIIGSLQLCIRMLLTLGVKEDFTPSHTYLREAKRLRPDIN